MKSRLSSQLPVVSFNFFLAASNNTCLPERSGHAKAQRSSRGVEGPYSHRPSSPCVATCPERKSKGPPPAPLFLCFCVLPLLF